MSSVAGAKLGGADDKTKSAAASTTTPAGPRKGGNGLPKRLTSESQSKVQTLFDYVPQSMESSALFGASTSDDVGVDPQFYTLGLKYSNGIIQGSNQRCIALLRTLTSYIRFFVTPEGKDFRHHFVTQLKINLNFLKKCRPFAVSMENAIEYFNSKCHGTSAESLEMNESDVKSEWTSALNDYLEGIIKAKEAIVEKSMDKIKNGDTILVYGHSEVISDILVAVSKQGTIKFSLIIIGDRPLAQERKGKGLEIVSALNEDSINSLTYTSFTGLSSIIQTVTKVFLGAHALLTNGGVLAHVGTAQIALMASTYNIPVLVCCETYKFCDKSPTDSFFHNELGFGFGKIQTLKGRLEEASGITSSSGSGAGGAEEEQALIESLMREAVLLTPVIKYDLTPPELVTAVITDVDILPCMSVPVVLRVQENRHLTSLHRS